MPEKLPKLFKNWNFLPKPLRSLEPYDKIIFKYVFCCKCCNKLKNNNTNANTGGLDNSNFNSAHAVNTINF